MYLKEEMHCVLAFLEWKAEWWNQHQQPRSDVSRELTEALSAYALTQEKLQRSLANHFRTLWKLPLEETAMEDPEDENGQERDDDNDDNEDNDDEDGNGSLLDEVELDED